MRRKRGSSGPSSRIVKGRRRSVSPCARASSSIAACPSKLTSPAQAAQGRDAVEDPAEAGGPGAVDPPCHHPLQAGEDLIRAVLRPASPLPISPSATPSCPAGRVFSRNELQPARPVLPLPPEGLPEERGRHPPGLPDGPLPARQEEIPEMSPPGEGALIRPEKLPAPDLRRRCRSPCRPWPGRSPPRRGGFPP